MSQSGPTQWTMLVLSSNPLPNPHPTSFLNHLCPPSLSLNSQHLQVFTKDHPEATESLKCLGIYFPPAMSGVLWLTSDVMGWGKPLPWRCVIMTQEWTQLVFFRVSFLWVGIWGLSFFPLTLCPLWHMSSRATVASCKEEKVHEGTCVKDLGAGLEVVTSLPGEEETWFGD